MKILLYGPPGAGKDTQGHILMQRYGAAFISAGRLLRTEMYTGSKIGQAITPCIQGGEPVPSDIVNRIIDRALDRSATQNGYIMNGFPRTADTLEHYLDRDRPDAVVVIQLDEKTLRFRLELRARFDDTPGTITRRLEVFRAHTPEILKRFEEVGVPVIRVDGLPPVRQVADSIAAGLKGAIRLPSH